MIREINEATGMPRGDVVHDRFGFENGGGIDIYRSPLHLMGDQEREELLLALDYIKAKFEVRLRHQRINEKLEKMILKQE